MPREDIPIIEPYNLLGRCNLGASVAAAMLTSPAYTLPPEPFIGAGVYVIYYRGGLAPYERLVDLNKGGHNVSIYVRRTMPVSVRKGGPGMNVDHGLALFNKLSEHSGSASKTNNLNEKDFMCRYLVMDDVWIPFTESMFIERFKPLWNRRIDGLGNHDPGGGRY